MTVRKATTENLDMKLYSKLIIEKVSYGCDFKICNEIRKEMAGGFRRRRFRIFKRFNKRMISNVFPQP